MISYFSGNFRKQKRFLSSDGHPATVDDRVAFLPTNCDETRSVVSLISAAI